MKRLILLVILLLQIVMLGQTNFNVSVIDSFAWTDYSGAGVMNADAEEFNGTIYLSYFYYPNASQKRYVVCARKGNGGFIFDTVAVFQSDGFSHASVTAIQIDQNGNPWVFYQYGGDLFAAQKVNNSWNYYTIIGDASIGGFSTIEGGSDKIGVFYVCDPDNGFSYKLYYAEWDGSSWKSSVVFGNPTHWRYSRPSSIRMNDDIYVSFITTTGSPDSIYAHVYRKSGSSWNEDFYDLVIFQIPGASISERALLGRSSNGNIFLWREYAQSDNGEDLGWRFFEKDNFGWHRINLNTPPSGFMSWPQGSNLAVTNENVVCMISEPNGFDPKISWAKPNGTCGVNEELPYWGWNPYVVWLQDVVTINDDIYIYYTDGASGNYNYPVTFKEAKVNINDLITSVNSKSEPIPGKYKLFQNYPNPFNPSTSIKYLIPASLKSNGSGTVAVKLSVYDILGREIATLVNEKQNPGSYEVNFNTSLNSSGIYYYRLQAGEFVQTKKMILIK